MPLNLSVVARLEPFAAQSGGFWSKTPDFRSPSGSIRATAYTQSRSGFVKPDETFEAAKDAQNVSDGVANPVTLR